MYIMNTEAIENQSVAANSGQFLTLRLGGEEYAIDILSVQEIRSYEETTRMVNAPSFVKGVVNLRGVIVPIVDMRLKLQLSKAGFDASTVVIILNLQGTVIGMVVDSVSDVVNLSPSAIKPSPRYESTLDTQFITGIASVGDRMLIIMNMDALMSKSELGVVAEPA
jgi:purine-binding chemotaxis protein CheW